MSVQALSWVLDNSKAEHAARLVLISIANHCDKFGKNAWPSIASIGAESRLCEREVRNSLRELEVIGELSTICGGGPRRSNLYSLPKMQGAENAPAENAGAEFPAKGQNSTKVGAEFVGAIRKNRPEPSLEPSSIREFISQRISIILKHQRIRKEHVGIGNAAAVARSLSDELHTDIPAGLVEDIITEIGTA